jgi:hypothetical protein
MKAKVEFKNDLDERFIKERKKMKAKFEGMKIAHYKEYNEIVEVKIIIFIIHEPFKTFNLNFHFYQSIKYKREVNRLAKIQEEYEFFEKRFQEEEQIHFDWIDDFEMLMVNEETKMYDNINNEEDRFMEFTNKEAERLLAPILDAKSKLSKEQEELTASFEEIKQKINERL